jgi:hypothetical protein
MRPTLVLALAVGFFGLLVAGHDGLALRTGILLDAPTAAPTATPTAPPVKRAAPSSANISIPATDPAGGVSMISPNPVSAVSYFKLLSASPITFSWTLTSLIASPSALTIQAYWYALCRGTRKRAVMFLTMTPTVVIISSQNAITYDVTPPTGIPAGDTSYVWNPAVSQQAPGAPVFAVASYTLRVFDNRGFAVAPSAGYLSPYAGTVFGLYSPAPYTPLASGPCRLSAARCLCPPRV